MQPIRTLIPLTCLLIATLVILIMPQGSDDAAAMSEEESHDTWPFLYDNHYIHTLDDDSNRDFETVSAGNDIIWELGFDGTHPYDDRFHEDVFLEVWTGGDQYELKLSIQNLNYGQNTFVVLELRDDQTIVADLRYELGARERKETWNLELKDEYKEDKNGATGHTFEKDNPLRIRLYNDGPTGNNIQVDYVWSGGNEYARLRATTHQMKLLEAKTYDWKGDEIDNEAAGGAEEKYFMPGMPSGKAIIDLRGRILDAYGNYDITEVAIKVFEEEGTTPLANGSATLSDFEDPEYYKGFSYTWNYSEFNLDPGKYYFKIVVKDQTQRTDDDHVIYTKNFEMGRYGTYMEDDDGEEEPHRYIGKGDSAEFHIRVYNVGTETDTIDVENDDPSGGWTAELDKTVVNPAPGEYEVVTLTVTAPADAGDETKVVSVKATAGEGGSEYEYYFDTRTTTTPLYGVELYFDLGGGEQGKGMEAEQEKNTEEKYDFVIQNTGTDTDTFTLDLYGKEPDWEAAIENAEGDEISEISLSKDEDATLYLVVTPGESGGDDTARMRVTATSQSSDEFHDTVWFNITRTFGVDLITAYELNGEDFFEAKAGSSGTFYLWVENQRDDDNYTFHFTVDSKSVPDDWIVNFLDNDVPVDPDQRERVGLRIIPKAREPYSEIPHEFWVRVEANEDESIYMKKLVKVKVERTYSLELSIDRTSRKVKPDKDVTFIITVTNTGNVEATVAIQAEEPGDWRVKFDPTSHLLGPGHQGDFTLTISAPGDADDGDKEDFTIEVYVDTGEGRVSEEENVRVEVEKSTGSTISEMITQPAFLMVIAFLVLIVVIGMNQMRGRAGYDEGYEEDEYEGEYEYDEEEGDYEGEDEYEYE